MHAKNLAIVWSPNLLRSMALDSGGAALLQVNVQAIIIEYLIRNAHVFFDEKAASAVIVANPRYSTGSRDLQVKVDSDTGKLRGFYARCVALRSLVKLLDCFFTEFTQKKKVKITHASL